MLNIVSLLLDSSQEAYLPIGKVKEVQKIGYDDVVYYLQKYYTESNIKKYLLDKNNKIFHLTSLNIESIKALKIVDIHDVEKKQIFKENKEVLSTNFLHYNCFEESNFVKIIFKDVFVNSLVEIIIGEIFMSKDKIYFVITIQNMNKDNCAWILQKKEIEICGMLQNIIKEKRFKRIIISILDYLSKYDKNEIELKEIMGDIINYATLGYESYNIVEEKENLIEYLKGMVYATYSNFIWEKVIQFIGEENLRILY